MEDAPATQVSHYSYLVLVLDLRLSEMALYELVQEFVHVPSHCAQVDEEDENASSGDEDEMDDKMGDIGDSELKEKLDDKLWGDDDKDKDSKEEEVGYQLYNNVFS